MTDDVRGDDRVDAADEAMARRLVDETPRPSQSLRRRVRGRVADAVGRRTLRRRAAVLVAGGAVLLVVSLALALSGPS